MARIDLLLFPEGKSKALTLSYDDGTIHDRKLLEMLNRYHVKGTFNINGGLFHRKETVEFSGVSVDISTIGEKELNDLYEGHEIAAHGFLHASLPTLARGAAAYEVLKDRERLEEISGKLVRGFAYPFGTYSESVKMILKTLDIEYARTAKSSYSFDLPEDFLEWSPTCHHDDEQLMTLTESFCTGTGVIPSPRLFYLWGHSYEFAKNENWEAFESFLRYVHRYRNEIWFATNIEISDYINAYRQLKYSADGNMIYNPTCYTIWILIHQRKNCILPGESLHLNS